MSAVQFRVNDLLAATGVQSVSGGLINNASYAYSEALKAKGEEDRGVQTVGLALNITRDLKLQTTAALHVEGDSVSAEKLGEIIKAQREQINKRSALVVPENLKNGVRVQLDNLFGNYLTDMQNQAVDLLHGMDLPRPEASQALAHLGCGVSIV